MTIFTDIVQAEQRIQPYIRTTPLDYSSSLSKLTGSRVYLKLENLQYTGSFKVRGAMNALLLLPPAERTSGVVTASSGNHGIATAFGLSTLKTQGIIFVPQNTSPTKIAAIQQYGVELRRWGEDAAETEAHARAYAAEHEMVYISPYNDWRVVSGQGTIGAELCRQCGQIDVVLVAVGGGGLISGIAEYVKTVFPQAEIIGCSPENSPVMARSVRAGQLLNMESLPTLSDGTAGGVEAGAITFPLCQRLVDDFLLVSEEEIRHAVRLCLETHHMLIEGAAGVPLAALLKTAERFRDKTVIIVLCGANMSVDTLKTIL
jgi:threonine dehydratase